MSNLSLPRLAANTIRFLAAEAVQKANSGHPGMPLGMADTAVSLWHTFLKHNPQDPTWVNRDRFVLSAGHGSMLLYSLLHLSGYDLPLEQIKQFRQWGSQTPGHPEYGHTPGVETTTGPLGQGFSTAVGMAITEQWLAAQFNKPDFPVVDHYTYVIASDGDMQEGITHESAALAGHLELGKLIVLYDDNNISIDGPTSLSFSEDVRQRFAAYGWHTAVVDGLDGTAVTQAITAARAVTDQPSLIACQTVIGYGSPNKANTAGIHGAPMGDEEIRLTKEALGWPLDKPFYVPDEARAYLDTTERGAAQQALWDDLFTNYRAQHPAQAAQFEQMLSGDLPPDWLENLPQFETGSSLATRAASGKVLAGIVPHIPAMLGGSADLTGSNKTDVKGTGHISRGDFHGRYVYYGVREHGMGAIMSGMALHGGVIPYGGTFLVFTDYMRGAMRLAALMHQRVIYVLTHDSIGLGEDGPTHQPIEHLMSLRAMPNMWVFRPAEANETAVAWQMALERLDGPTALILTRQDLPTLSANTTAGAKRGAYVVSDTLAQNIHNREEPQVLLLATGSEVEIAMQAQVLLAEAGVGARVVSMPCWELFATQPQAYQDEVLPPHITARVAIEAGVTLGWERYVGTHGRVIGLDHFGASAPYEELYERFGLTATAVVQAARALL